jgi:predicted acetyltransferase
MVEDRPVTELTVPDVALHPSWAAALRELHQEAEHVNGAGLWLLPEAERWDLSKAGCRRLVAALLDGVDPGLGRAEDSVPCHFLWITDGSEVIGFLALRTLLNDWLLEQGGHIGYSVVPSRRRQGHATRALALAIRRAGELGIDRVLVVCDDENVPSARTIEACGGALEDVRHGHRRYWIAATE